MHKLRVDLCDYRARSADPVAGALLAGERKQDLVPLFDVAGGLGHRARRRGALAFRLESDARITFEIEQQRIKH